MRIVLAAALALVIGAPLTAQAAGSAAANDINNMVAAYQGIQAVRVVERFENGAVATVDVLPAGQFRVAESGGQDPALVVKVATQPADGAEATGSYSIKQIGSKTIDGIRANGYQVAAPDGTYNETIWVSDKQHLPLQAHVETQGHTIDVSYGDYNDTALVARP
jgi:outer membrane lipoprotein-sorting protein